MARVPVSPDDAPVVRRGAAPVVAPRPTLIKCYSDSAPHSPTAQSPSGFCTPELALKPQVSRLVRATSWQRLQTLLRAHLVLSEHGPTLSPQEQHLFDTIHNEARRIAGAAETGAGLLMAMHAFDSDIDAQQAALGLQQLAFTEALRRDCMAVLFERLSRMHGLCDKEGLTRWVETCRMWCGAAPPAACVGLVWLAYMRAHPPASTYAALAQLDSLALFLVPADDAPQAFPAAWAYPRLIAAMALWRTLCEAQRHAQGFSQDARKLRRRTARMQARIASLS